MDELSKLDPKLKEAYERVMNINLPHHATPTVVIQQQEHEKEKPESQMTHIGGSKKTTSAKTVKAKSQFPVLIGAAVAFLLIYAVVWAAILGVKPF